MKKQNRRVEQAISTGRVVNAIQSQNEFIRFNRDRLRIEKRMFREELEKTSDLGKKQAILEAMAENKAESAAFEQGVKNSSLRSKLFRGMDKDAELDGHGQIETRLLAPSENLLMTEPTQSEHRAKQKKTIYGYAAVFGKLSLDLGGFVEKIKPGAFAEVLRKNELDVRCLVNHDSNLLLGRTISSSLRLYENRAGLLYYSDLLSADGLSEGISARVGRGDITGCSFSFIVAEDAWKFSEKQGDLDERTIIKIAELFDVGPVTYPAYPDTTVGIEKKSIDRAGDTYEEEIAGRNRLKMAKARLFELDYKRAGQFIDRYSPAIKREVERKYRFAGRIINRNKVTVY